LEHLALQDIGESFEWSLEQWLPFLPNLISLKFASDKTFSMNTFFEIGRFIAAHPLLRRLDIGIEVRWDSVSALLSTISRLQNLEVLGIFIGPNMPSEGLQFLSQNIPTKITSLALSLPKTSLFPLNRIGIDSLVSLCSSATIQSNSRINYTSSSITITGPIARLRCYIF
jgi:hypothetical protein